MQQPSSLNQLQLGDFASNHEPLSLSRGDVEKYNGDYNVGQFFEDYVKPNKDALLTALAGIGDKAGQSGLPGGEIAAFAVFSAIYFAVPDTAEDAYFNAVLAPLALLRGGSKGGSQALDLEHLSDARSLIKGKLDELIEKGGPLGKHLEEKVLPKLQEVLDLEKKIDSAATPRTAEQFEKLFVGSLTKERQFIGRPGNVDTRLATIRKAMEYELKGFSPLFEQKIPVTGSKKDHRYIDLLIRDSKGNNVEGYQLVKGRSTSQLNRKDELAAQSELSKALGIPVHLLLTGR